MAPQQASRLGSRPWISNASRRRSWACERRELFDLSTDEAANVIEHWRASAAASTGEKAIVAGPFQRHLTARGTGVPSNFSLVLTSAEVIACKFDPARTEHPPWLPRNPAAAAVIAALGGELPATA